MAVLALLTAGVLVAVGALHVLWVFSPWPLRSREEFARRVVGVPPEKLPSPGLTLAVAVLLGGAAVVEVAVDVELLEHLPRNAVEVVADVENYRRHSDERLERGLDFIRKADQEIIGEFVQLGDRPTMADTRPIAEKAIAPRDYSFVFHYRVPSAR